jgi:hypothetical protein
MQRTGRVQLSILHVDAVEPDDSRCCRFAMLGIMAGLAERLAVVAVEPVAAATARDDLVDLQQRSRRIRRRARDARSERTRDATSVSVDDIGPDSLSLCELSTSRCGLLS